VQTKRILRHIACAALGAGLLGSPVCAGQSHPNKDARAAFDGLSREMSTCAAYFSLLASIIEKAKDSAANVEIAHRIKSTGQLMLAQSINIANYVGLGDEVVMQRVQEALKEMVDTVNSDPPNSLRVMHANYGQPCDELLQSAPERFAELLEDHQEEF
jgi:hypothetical protein